MYVPAIAETPRVSKTLMRISSLDGMHINIIIDILFEKFIIWRQKLLGVKYYTCKIASLYRKLHTFIIRRLKLERKKLCV